MSCTGFIWISAKQIDGSCKFVNDHSSFSWITKEQLIPQVQGGPRKVARLPFCTCPCDILSGVRMYIA